MRWALGTGSRSGFSGDFGISQKLGVLLVALGRKDVLSYWYWGGPGHLGSRDLWVPAGGAKGY